MTYVRVKGFQQYEINEHGDIRRAHHHSKQSLVPTANAQGILKVGIYKFDERYTRSVARLVAENFLPPPPAEHFNTVIHLDMDKTNCHASNLAWRPRAFALEYHRQYQYDAWVRSHQPLTNHTTGQRYNNLREMCLEYGLLLTRTQTAMNRSDPIFPIGHYATFDRL